MLHGVAVSIASNSGVLVDSLRRDFSWFLTPGPASETVEIEAWLREPAWSSAPAGRCVMVQPTCVVYEHGAARWVDYQGRALCRFSHAEEHGEIWSMDADLLYEVTYLFLLSRVGEIHDRRGLHRIHALGLSLEGRGVICMLPSGGGKTTLGLHALRNSRAHLLSDDTPLVTRSGALLAFPNRVGCVGKPEGIPDRYLRQFARRAHGDKWLIDIDAFADRIDASASPHAVILGARQLSGPGRLEEIPRHQAAGELFRSIVVGLGLPQVVEYFLRFDPADVIAKAKIVASRAMASAALVGRAKTFRLHLARDRAHNARLLTELLERL